ncbi:MAG: SRPBCC domain-containing protein [Leptospiraceae bacterium]|nr:SRPBCC domain-containing protein [Leptospiraceae bacterium]MBK8394909.1 SRPBCC domain-containing protein [Leptospiraceae bacterium]
MNEINTEITINAPKKIIWDILTDFSAYSQWNPFLINVIGSATPGGNVFFVAKSEGAIVPVFANIIEYEFEKKFSWGGPPFTWFKSIFGAEHFFIIEEISPAQCRFRNNERMEGVVADAAWTLIERSVPAYHTMNQALKKRAEAGNK